MSKRPVNAVPGKQGFQPTAKAPIPAPTAAPRLTKFSDPRHYTPSSTQEVHYSEQYARLSEEPVPTDIKSHMVTHPTLPRAIVTVSKWSDGMWTVDMSWRDRHGAPHAETLLTTDDEPDTAGAIAAWQEQMLKQDNI